MSDRWDVAIGTLETAFCFLVGSCVGSFLNVVIHRLPRGMNLIRPRSQCPRCGSPIRPRDNVPIAGWLMLGGHCRDCQAPIPARYPLVEAACGCLAVLAFRMEAGPGWFESLVLVWRRPGTIAWGRLVRSTGEFVLLSNLLVLAAMALEFGRGDWGSTGERSWARVRRGTFIVFVGLVIAACWPENWQAGWRDWRLAIETVALGSAMGAGLAFLCPDSPARWGLFQVGTFLGWQTALAAWLATTLGRTRWRPAWLPPVAIVALVALGRIVLDKTGWVAR